MRRPPATPGRSRRTARGRRRRAASRAPARAPRHRAPAIAAGRPRRRAPAGPTTGAVATIAAAQASRAAVDGGVDRRGVRGCVVQDGPRASRPIHLGFGPSSTSTPIASTRAATRGRCRRWPPRRPRGSPGLAIAAELADVLAGGRLQFAGRRRFARATQGLDASAHARTVRRAGDPRQPAPRGSRARGVGWRFDPGDRVSASNPGHVPWTERSRD